MVRIFLWWGIWIEKLDWGIRRNGVTHSLTHQSIAFSASYILYVAGNCTFLDTCSKDGQATGAAPASCCSLNQESVFELFFPKARVRQVGIKAALLQYRAGLMLKVTLKVGFVSHYHLALVIFFFSFSLHCINIRIVWQHRIRTLEFAAIPDGTGAGADFQILFSFNIV